MIKITKLQLTLVHTDGFQNKMHHIIEALKLKFITFGFLFHQVVLTFIFLNVLVLFIT
jgi:hypothetical protein